MTTKQRLAIYKKMLKWFEKGDFGCFYPCFCVAIWISIYGNNEIKIKHYPELLKHKPKITKDSVHWFNTGKTGIEKRKQILRKIIKEMS